jgi:hypothetical protein
MATSPTIWLSLRNVLRWSKALQVEHTGVGIRLRDDLSNCYDGVEPSKIPLIPIIASIGESGTERHDAQRFPR